MSLEAIQKVTQAEAESKQRKAEAAAAAKKLTADAEQAGRKALQDACRQAEAKAKELMAQAEERAAVRTAEIAAQSERDRAALRKGAEAADLFVIPFRERIGRAKSVPDEKYPAVFAEMAKEMAQQIDAIAARGGADE